MSVISKKALINEEIKAKEVRVVSADGAQIGVLSIEKALRMAFEAGLDLVEIAPEGKPPVCKIMDFGRYRFEREKREKEIRKNQQTTELKELQLTCNIGQHDLQTKLNHATRFLTAGNKVKVIVKFRGREMAHTERGRDLLDRFASGEIDRLCVIYTDSKGMSEVVRQTQLLPLRRQSFSVKSGEEQPEPTFEFVPTMEAVLDKLVRNYISGYIYSALVDSFCSEQSARMAAMSAANDNAEELLGDLSKQFNRARQAAITQEITEISAGARAQKNKKSREADQS